MNARLIFSCVSTLFFLLSPLNANAELILKIADITIQQSSQIQFVDVPVYGFENTGLKMQAFNLIFDVGNDNLKKMPTGFTFATPNAGGGLTSQGDWVITVTQNSNLPNQNFDLYVLGDATFFHAIRLEGTGNPIGGAHLFSLKFAIAPTATIGVVPISFAQYFPLPAVFDSSIFKTQIPFASNGLQAGSITIESKAVPEPNSLLLMSLVFGATAYFRKKPKLA